MASALQNLYKQTLIDTGRINPAVLGKPKTEIVGREITSLTERLEKQSNFNNMMIILIIIMLFILFLVAIFLVLKNSEDPAKINLIFGGSFLSILTIITVLRKLWKEKNAVDMLIAILPDMQPEEALKIIELLYYKSKREEKPA